MTRDPAHLGGLTVAITMGGSKAESRTTESIATVVPSLVMAGKNITIQAAGKPESRLSVQGSQVRAGDMVTLEAAGDLLLQAQANTTRQTMDSDSRGGGIGLALSMGRQGVGVGLIGNTAQGKGRASGEAIEWSPTAIEAGRRASLISGGNTELSGGMVKAPGVDVTVGRDLNIESLQDRRHYESHQQTIAASIVIPATSSAGASAQVNATKSDIRSDYVSTTGVTGIQAGDDGFRGDVAGAAQLKGASITSTDRAVETGVNHFSSASLTLSDLTNRADYTAQGAGMGIGMGVNPQGDYAPKGSHAGLGKESGHQAGVTVAGISDIAGNKAVRTGDPATGVARIFDAERIAKEINAQVTMTQEFTGNAYRAVDNYVSQNRKALQLALKEARDSDVTQELNARLSQLRREEQVMNILIGSLAGMGGTAVTKEGLSSAAEKMRALMMEDSERFAGVTDGRTVISNVSGESEGVRSDGIKLGGTRIDPDLLCGKNNEHCEVIRDAKGHPVLDTNGKTTLALNDQQMIVFMTSKKYPSLQSYLDSSDGLKMYGSTGGIQGYRGTFFGVEYKPGSWQDRLIEAFSGTHDLIGGRTFHLYDDRGNAKRGMSDSERAAQNVWSTLAIVPSSPFAVAELFPASVWQALSILVQAAR